MSSGSSLLPMPEAASHISALKRPDSCWPHRTTAIDGSRVVTVLEVAWATVTVKDMERELAFWSGGGRNAIVFKVWWKHREGDEAALRESLPLDFSVTSWVEHASILFITQGAHDSYKKVWRVGQPAEGVSLQDSDRTIEMRESG